jgi:hypothetical protein
VLQRYRTHQVFEAMVQTQHSIQINRGHCVIITNGKKTPTLNPPLGSNPRGARCGMYSGSCEMQLREASRAERWMSV